jgi:hypothetical protein
MNNITASLWQIDSINYVNGELMFTDDCLLFKSNKLKLALRIHDIAYIQRNNSERTVNLVMINNDQFEFLLPKKTGITNKILATSKNTARLKTLKGPLLPNLLYPLILIYMFFAFPITHILLADNTYPTLTILLPSLIILIGLIIYYSFLIFHYGKKLPNMPKFKLFLLNFLVPFVGHVFLSKYFSRLIVEAVPKHQKNEK